MPRSAGATVSAQHPARQSGRMRKHGPIFFTFGVLLPLLALIFETNTHFCAENCFDPFPSNGHVLLFSLIPLSNFLTWLSSRRDLSQHSFFMALLSGMAMGIGALYTLMFLPITPLCCMWTLALGIGLLGFAPLLSLPCNWMSGKRACHMAEAQKTYFNAHQVEHIGHLIILVMVIAVELPSTLTRINLANAAQAGQSNEAKQNQAIAWLRQWGSKEVLLRACYERSGRATDILGSLYEGSHPVNPQSAQQIFYRVTGEPYNTVAIPASARASLQHTGSLDNTPFNQGVEDEFDLDNDVAGEEVATVARGLSADACSVQGNIDAEKALARINWSISFDNKSQFDREARLKLLLPHDAVVSKAQVTMDGKTREAVFMAREAARNLYRDNAAQKLDPLLVSYAGIDRIMVQAYPIRPSLSPSPGGRVKIDLTIEAPLQIDRQGKATLTTPIISEQNFQIESPVKLDLTANQSMLADLPASSLQFKKSESEPGKFVFSTECPAKALSQYGQVLRFDRPLNSVQYGKLPDSEALRRLAGIENSSWTEGKYSPAQPGIIARKLEPDCFPKVNHFDIIVDGSVSMKNYPPQIASALASIEGTKTVRLTLVADGIKELCPSGTRADSPEFKQALKTLSEYQPRGGQDCSEAVLQAIAANSRSDSCVLSIHGPQPVYSTAALLLTGSLEQSRQGRLYDLQVVAGPNVVAEHIKVINSYVRVPNYQGLGDDLKSLFQAMNQKPSMLPAPAAPTNVEEEPALTRIWLNRTILSIDQSRQDEFAQLASQQKIVSPVSSAIVNEESIDRVLPKPVKLSFSKQVKNFLNQCTYLFQPAATAPPIVPYSVARKKGDVMADDYMGTDEQLKQSDGAGPAAEPKALPVFEKISGEAKIATAEAEKAKEVAADKDFDAAGRNIPSQSLDSSFGSIQTNGPGPQTAQRATPTLQGATNGLVGAPVAPHGQSNETIEEQKNGDFGFGLGGAVRQIAKSAASSAGDPANHLSMARENNSRYQEAPGKDMPLLPILLGMFLLGLLGLLASRRKKS